MTKNNSWIDFKKKLNDKEIQYRILKEEEEIIRINNTEYEITYDKNDLYISERLLSKKKIITNIENTIKEIKEAQETEIWLDTYLKSARSTKVHIGMVLSMIWGIISGLIVYYTSNKSPYLTGITLGGSIGITFVINLIIDKNGAYKYWGKTTKKKWKQIMMISIGSVSFIFLLQPIFNFLNNMILNTQIPFGKYTLIFSNFIMNIIDILGISLFTALFCVSILRLMSDWVYSNIVEHRITDNNEKRIGRKYYNSHEFFLPKDLLIKNKISINAILAYLIMLECIDNQMEENKEYNQDILKVNFPIKIIKKILSIDDVEIDRIKLELIHHSLIEEKVDERSREYIIVNEFR